MLNVINEYGEATIVCGHCGKSFTAYGKRIGIRLYCSIPCKKAAASLKRRKTLPATNKQK